MNADDRYRLMSETGAIILVVEAERLEATDAGKSTPERIWGAMSPGEVVVRRRRTMLSVMRWVCFRMGWWPVYRRPCGAARASRDSGAGGQNYRKRDSHRMGLVVLGARDPAQRQCVIDRGRIDRRVARASGYLRIVDSSFLRNQDRQNHCCWMSRHDPCVAGEDRRAHRL